MENNSIAKNYSKAGYVVSKNLIEENENFISFRDELDIEFANHKEEKGASRFLENFNNIELVKAY